MLAKGKTTTEIAKHFKIGTTSVRNIYKYYNIETEYSNSRKTFDKEKLEELYVEKGLTMKEVAVALNASYSAIQRALRKFKITEDSRIIKDDNEFITLVLEGKTIRELMDIYSCSRENINYHITRLELDDKYNKVQKEIVVDIELLKEAYLDRSKSVQDICKEFNLAQTSLNRIINKHGIPNRQNKVEITKEELYQFYAEEKLPMKDIAELFNCNKVTVLKYLDKFGIESRETVIDLQYVKEKVKEITSNEYEVIEGEYKNDQSPLLFRHNSSICNNSTFKSNWNMFRSGNRCRNCKYIKLRKQFTKDTDWFKNNHIELLNGEYELLDEYVDSHTPLTFIHNECKFKFTTTPNRFQQGARCPRCNLNTSHPEKEIADFINELYDGTIIKNSRKVLGNGQEVDIYLPDINVAIEFNGLYWHSEEGSKGKCDKNYHLNKTLLANEKDIKLIHIFEDEWYEKKELVKSKIAHICGLNNNPSIYARKCTIKEVSPSEKNVFLEENHIQGKDTSILNLGLYYEDRLVSIMTFCNLRRSMGYKKAENVYELSRFATDNNYKVVGAFGKLWKYFVNNYEFEKIITYADLRWSVGNLYEVSGFNYVRTTQPNYWYTTGSKRYYRYNFRKSKLSELFPDVYSDDKTEREIMQEKNFKRIWDCGHLLYEYVNKD